MLRWFESYLTNRTQYVVFDGEKSDTNSIKCGVPQGSILGPLITYYAYIYPYMTYCIEIWSSATQS